MKNLFKARPVLMKILILVVFLVCISFPVSAQGLYFDIGLGVGYNLGNIPSKTAAITLDADLRVGYGPFGIFPVYAVGEVGVVEEIGRLEHIFFNNDLYKIGLGVIFYPLSFLQLSVGASIVANQTPLYVFDVNKNGFEWHSSIAIDFGKSNSNHGWLLGLKIFDTVNFSGRYSVKKASVVSLFVKYAYRSKVNSSIATVK